ncbi:MAG: cyclic nucleotide-binding domain-containing protein [Mariprofundus sp.]|nr:cyclic nucleotide-binding domain-containing protein [Mariprofundus sp.]
MTLNKQELMQSYQMLHQVFPEDLHIVRPFIHMLRQSGKDKQSRVLAMAMARRMLALGNSDQAIGLLTLCQQLNHSDSEAIGTLSDMAHFSIDCLEGETGRIFALTEYLSDSETLGFIKQGKLVQVAENEDIVRQGESSTTFYLILDGVVDVRIRMEDGNSVIVKKLTSGDFFGEFACVYKLRRSASVVASSPSLLLEFSDHSIAELIKYSPMAGDYLIRTVQSRMVHAMTHSLPAFNQLPEADRRWIAEESTVNEYSDGTSIMESEQKMPVCHILLSGSLELKLPDGRVIQMTSGMMFGDINPYICVPLQTTLKAKEHTLICNMPKNIFQSFMNVYPSFEQYIKTQHDSLALMHVNKA